MKLITNYFKLSNARQFIDSVGSANSVFYMFVGKHTPFTNDSIPPTPYETVKDTVIDVYENMLYGKHITSSDVAQMVNRYNWTSGTKYAKYAHDDNTLSTKKYFVVALNAGSYDVFKCLDNNGGVASTVQPSRLQTSADDDFYFTSDGYQWKFMYTIDQATMDKFATVTHIPVVANNAVSGNAASGAIEVISVVKGGARYNSYTSGTFQAISVGGNTLIHTIDPTAAANNDFYVNCSVKITSGSGSGEQRKIANYIVAGSTKRIVLDSPFTVQPTTSSTYEITPSVTIAGDGQGAVARALVNAVSNTIYRIEMTERGSGYSWATASVAGNTGILSTANALIAVTSATLQPIISPPGGHGKDPAAELNGHHIGISLKFTASESDNRVINENDFRQIGIIRDPLFANVEVSYADAVGTGFEDGELIIQDNTGASGIVTYVTQNEVRMSNVHGFFVTGNTSYRLLRGQTSNTYATAGAVTSPGLYFDQTHRVIAERQTTQNFNEDEVVYQTDVGIANAYCYFANTEVVRITNLKGVINLSEDTQNIDRFIVGKDSGASSRVTGQVYPDLVKGSGQVVYIENVTPVTKAANQSESVKLILEF